MTFLAVAGICSLVVLVYFSRLMSDAKKLEARLHAKPAEFPKPARDESPLLPFPFEPRSN